MSRFETGAAAALFLLASPAAAEGPPASGDVDIPYSSFELENGLKVLVHEDHSIPVVHTEVWYHVGSSNEREGLTGFAHLFEHLMFQGSLNHDSEYFEPLQKVGAQVNGTTSQDRTNYYEALPSNYLDLALWLEADRMGWLLPALTQEKLDNQREVVKNERRQRYENQPYGMARWWVHETIYPEGHPYHHLTIGSQEDLTAASIDDVKAFFQAYYVPNNATLCVAGDVTVDEVKAAAERYFAGVPTGAEVAPATAEPVKLDQVIRLEKEDNVSLPRLMMVWPSPAIFGEGDADLDILSTLLTDGLSSRLYNALVYEGRMAQSVNAYQASSRLGSLYYIDVVAADGHSLEEIEKTLDRVLNEVRKAPPTAEEVSNALNGWEARFIYSQESVSSKAGTLCSYDFQAGDPGYIQKDLARYRAVTPESVQKAANTWLRPDGRLILSIVPKAADAGGNTP